MNVINKSFKLNDGREISIETGKLAKQADGSVVVKMGNTMLLATVVSEKEAGENVNFLPLMVDYKEKYSATGTFPGGFLKREARPSDYEILVCRLVDRALRPMFPEDYHASTMVGIQLISCEDDDLPDALACLAASSAIAVSDIPFNGPISEVRVARIDGEFILNPTQTQLAEADMDMVIAATDKNVVMVEGEMRECSEEEMVAAIEYAHEAIKVQCAIQVELAKAVGKEIREYNHEDSDEDLYKQINDACYQKCYAVAEAGHADKKLRGESFKAIKEEFVATLDEEVAKEKAYLIGFYFHKVEKEAVRDCVLTTKKRLDGRALNEVRPIWSEVNYLPKAHGSAVFTRGETQSLTSVTLGTKRDEQLIDGAVIKGYNNFLLHYNFPSFSTGEARMPRGTSRREIGHGNLALRAIKDMVDECPYTIRIISEILESNGSSSMATVCASSLALMDAGVPMKSAVSGIAMGLITDDKGRVAVLSDILGDEDHLGDMDFKVTGTENGITACQMDIKVDGLPKEVLVKALMQAKEGRAHILGEMNKTLTQSAEDYKPHTPRIVQIEINKEDIGAVIGPGGKVVQEIQKVTGATVSIDEVDDKGVVEVFANDKDAMDAAVRWIKGIVAKPEVGETYEATVKSIMPYGAFVEFMPGKQGLLHISEISWSRIETMEGVFEENETVKVKLLDIDKKTGKFRLSRKVLMPKPEKKEEQA